MERALLVMVHLRDAAYRDSWPVADSAAELKELARSSGLGVVHEMTLQRGRPTPRYLVGKGAAEDLGRLCGELRPDVVVFGADLGPAQQRNLEELIGLKTIDRTQLILDIFAQRARSQEGKVQVELAQLQYLLPRLVGKGILLSGLGGGIGTRGPGEKKLEVDRRRIRDRIRRLRDDLEEVHRRRGVARAKRLEQEVPAVALIGYTNAGKTTLLNALTGAGAAAEDRLFTTLDPLARRVILPSGQPALLTDTVGFLHRLPHHLIEAFRATLEETVESQLLLHVVDLSNPLLEEQSAAVHEVLRELDAEQNPVLTVLNKVDRVEPGFLQAVKRRYPEGVFVSAKTGEGLPYLLQRVGLSLSSRMEEVSLLLPAGAQRWLGRIYEEGKVLERRSGENGVIEVRARVSHRLRGQLQKAGLICDGRSI